MQMPGRIADLAEVTEDRPDRSSSGETERPEHSSPDGACRGDPAAPGRARVPTEGRRNPGGFRAEEG